MKDEKEIKNGDIYRNLVDIVKKRNTSYANLLTFIDKSYVGGPAAFEADEIVSNYNKLKRLIGNTPARIVAPSNCKIYELNDDIIINMALDLWFENNPEVRAKIFRRFIDPGTTKTILSSWHDEPVENNGLYETHVIHVAVLDGCGYIDKYHLEYYTGFNLSSFFNCYDDFYNIAPLGRYTMKDSENYQDDFFDQCDKYREKGMSLEDYIAQGCAEGKFNIPEDMQNDIDLLNHIRYAVEDYCESSLKTFSRVGDGLDDAIINAINSYIDYHEGNSND